MPDEEPGRKISIREYALLMEKLVPGSEDHDRALYGSSGEHRTLFLKYGILK